MNRHENPLANWLRQATKQQRQRAADLAGTSVAYFYALSGYHRQCPRADKAFAMEDAFFTLHKESNGTLPLITARQISMISALRGL